MLQQNIKQFSGMKLEKMILIPKDILSSTQLVRSRLNQAVKALRWERQLVMDPSQKKWVDPFINNSPQENIFIAAPVKNTLPKLPNRIQNMKIPALPQSFSFP